MIASRFRHRLGQELSGISLSILKLAIGFGELGNFHRFCLGRIRLILVIGNIQKSSNFFTFFLKLVLKNQKHKNLIKIFKFI